jgi:hypothetical protein
MGPAWAVQSCRRRQRATLLRAATQPRPRSRIEAVWLGRRINERLASGIRRRYPTVTVYRDRAAMTEAHPLTRLDLSRSPRMGEAARRRLRTLMWTFLGAVAAVGCVLARTVVSGPPGAVVWLTLLATGLLVVGLGLGQRSSVLTLQGTNPVAWLVTANPTTVAGWVMRVVLALLMGWVAFIWWRAATPGRRVRNPRLEQALRRWRGQLPGAR